MTDWKREDELARLDTERQAARIQLYERHVSRGLIRPGREEIAFRYHVADLFDIDRAKLSDDMEAVFWKWLQGKTLDVVDEAIIAKYRPGARVDG
jgi:hypothetical protein